MWSSLASSLLSVGVGACALSDRPDDGLVNEEPSSGHQFGSVASSSEPVPGLVPGQLMACKNPGLFAQHVLPHFIQRCVECHDGTKLKASFALYLADAASPDVADQKSDCDLTLTSAVSLQERMQSTVLVEVDPARPDLEHDFKYDPAGFALYREAVMMWLIAE
jgi:hypothetical protein